MKEKAWQDIGRLKQAIDKDRQQLSELAGELLRVSKRAIFTLQRQDKTESTSRLKKADELLKSGLKIVGKQTSLQNDGVWRAAMEEYAEAYIFNSFLSGQLKFPVALKNYPDSIYGGLADAAGEMARMSVLSATEGDAKNVERAYQITLQIVEHLAMLELTGNLRSKFDQSKSHLRRIEDIRYDLSKRSLS